MRLEIPSGVMFFFLLHLSLSLSAFVPSSQHQFNSGNTSCDTIFTDAGGTNGNYSNNESQLFTFYPDSGQLLHYSFTSFSLEEGHDVLYLYSGTDTTGNLLGVFTGNSLPPGGQSTDSSGALTFYFFSDSITTSDGWEIHLFCQNPIVCPVPKINVIGNTTLCAGSTVLLVSDMESNITWSSNGSTNDSLSVNASGLYWVTYDNGNGCVINSDTVSVVVNPLPAAPQLVVSGPALVCPGTIVTMYTDATGSIAWYNNNSIISGQLNDTLQTNQSGSYLVTNTVNGCQSISSPVTITHLPAPVTPVATPLGATTFCQGNTVVLVSSSANFNQWYLNGTALTGGAANFFTASQSGQYQVAVSQANGCSSISAPVTVNALASPAVPLVTAPSGSSACQGSAVILQSDAGPGLQWYRNNNPVSGAIGTTYNALLAGTYKTIVTAANGCSNTSNTLTVTINSLPPIPQLSVNGSLTSCSNQAPVLSSNATSGNQWLLNGSQISGANATSFSPLSSGAYRVMVTNSNGCTNQSTVRNVSLIPAPNTVQTTVTTTACNANTGSISIQGVIGGTAPYLYSLNNSPFQNQVNYSSLASGTYTLSVSDANSCTYQTTLILQQQSGPDTSFIQSLPANCAANGSLVVNSSSGGMPPYQYALGNGNFSGSMQFNGLLPGNYSLHVKDAAGCIRTFGMQVGGTPPATAPQITASSLFVCANDSVLLSTNPSIPVAWFNGTVAPEIMVYQGGNYAAVYTDNNNCSSSSNTLAITQLPAAPVPVLSLSGVSYLCPGSSIMLGSNLSGGNTWNGSISGDSLSVSATGMYWVRHTTAEGCSANSDTLTLLEGQLPDVPLIVQHGDTLLETQGNVVNWYLSGSSQLLTAASFILPNVSGEYTAIAVNAQGCSSASAPYPYIYTGFNETKPIDLQGNNLLLNVSGKGIVRIYDTSGRLCGEHFCPGAGQTQVSLDGLSQGMYLLECICGQNRVTFAFCKNRN